MSDNKNGDNEFAIGFGLGWMAAAGIAAALLWIFGSPNDDWETKIIERGFGLYCPKTGEFAFVGECEGK